MDETGVASKRVLRMENCRRNCIRRQMSMNRGSYYYLPDPVPELMLV